jgi:hypothetical protein
MPDLRFLENLKNESDGDFDAGKVNIWRKKSRLFKPKLLRNLPERIKHGFLHLYVPFGKIDTGIKLKSY